MTLTDRIAKALRDGAETSYEIEAVTGVPCRRVSNLLASLHHRGKVVHVGTVAYRRQTLAGRNSRPNWRYRLAGGGR